MTTEDPLRQVLADRLLARIKVSESGCWLFTGCITENGYGGLAFRGRSYKAHRFSYEVFKGPIPKGMQLDHKCHTPEICLLGTECQHRRCINPEHLEPVTHMENYLRGHRHAGYTAFRKSITHCRHGHEYTAENTCIRATGRTCRICNRERARAKYHRGKEAIESRTSAGPWTPYEVQA